MLPHWYSVRTFQVPILVMLLALKIHRCKKITIEKLTYLHHRCVVAATIDTTTVTIKMTHRSFFDTDG